MERFIDEVSQMEDLIAGDGVTEDEISLAEKQLGIRFAKEYKAYLANWGIAAVNGHELTGLDVEPRVNVVYETERNRKKFAEPLKDMYVVENDNIDGVVYWQDASGRVYRTVNQSKPKYISDSLLDFIKR